MKRWMKASICIFLSFAFLFIGVGYAAVSNLMGISGSVEAVAQQKSGIYISNVEIVSSTNKNNVNNIEIVYPTTVRTNVNASSRNFSVTYKITVVNETAMTYWYTGIKNDGTGDNSLVGQYNGITITTRDGESSSSTAFDTNDWVPPKTTREFYATYVYGSNAQGTKTNLINFSFGLKVGSIADEFLEVLNDKITDTGYSYLASEFDKNYKEGDGIILGNIGDDEEVFDNIFGEDIMITVNGEKVPATIIVERRNVDKKETTGDQFDANGAPSGCEYTVYISIDDLSNENGTSTVYAVSYSCGPDGVWYMIGELYEGTCPNTDYDPSTPEYEKGFDVTQWVATKKEYTVIGDLTYKVAYSGQGQPYDFYDTVDELMGEFDQEFYNRINNNAKDFLQQVLVTVYSFHWDNSIGQSVSTLNPANVGKEGYEQLKTALERFTPYCLIANGTIQVSDNVKVLSRAEIIPMLEDIQKYYDYFISVNS